MTEPDALAEPPITVMGVGNLLWGDEGTGPRLAALLSERLKERPELAPRVEVVDGGTQGLYLLPRITETRNLLLLDAVSLGLPPGEMVVLEGEDVESRFSTLPVSLHQTTLQDLLASARLLGWQPERLTLIGIQAEDTESWGGPLTATVSASLEGALTEALTILENWSGELAAA